MYSSYAGGGGGGVSSNRRSIQGTVTKLFDNFGYVNDEIFFMKNVVSGRMVRLGDRVRVEALYQPNMPVKWNAERVSAEGGGPGGDMRNRRDQSQGSHRSGASSNYRNDSRSGGVKRPAPSRGSAGSSVRPYVVHIPQRLFNLEEASVMELRQRYPRLYIPSDFFHSTMNWQELFPVHRSMKLGLQANFAVLHKDVESLIELDEGEFSDHDYSYSAKVMLLSTPEQAALFSQCCGLAQDSSDVKERFTHLSKMLQFVCGTTGGKANEPFALGGPWSAAADGDDPTNDPKVLVNTAIRHVKKLAGLDLSACTTWYRFLEIHYYRQARPEKQKDACVETVVVFIPDVWSLMPTEEKWSETVKSMEAKVEALINPVVPEPEEPDVTLEEPSAAVVDDEEMTEATNKDTEDDQNKTSGEEESGTAATADEESQEEDEANKSKESTEGATSSGDLDVQNMKVADLRKELEQRGKSTKGLKAQLVARLEQALVEEKSGGGKDSAEDGVKKTEDKKAEETDDDQQKKDEGEKTASAATKTVKLSDKEIEKIKRIHTLPSKPSILMQPSKTAKSGKLELTVVSLNQLLSYRLDASKEHTFETSVFAEQFNEMLCRDFSFGIYAGLVHQTKLNEEAEAAAAATKEEQSKEETKEESSEGQPAEKKTKVEDVTVAPRKILRTVRPNLLMAFVFFDQQQAGYLMGKDIENIVSTLGLCLSRAQIRKLVETSGGDRKSNGDTQLKYRKLTDLEVKSDEEQSYLQNEDTASWLQLVDGNRSLLGTESSKVYINTDAAENNLREMAALKTEAETRFKQCSTELTTLMKKLETAESERAVTETEAVELREKVRQLRKEESGQRHLAADYRRTLKDTVDKVERAIAGGKDLFERERKEVERKQKEEEDKRKAEEEAAAAAAAKENGEKEEDASAKDGEDVEMKPTEGEWSVVDAV